jgi:hypothetical protein
MKTPVVLSAACAAWLAIPPADRPSADRIEFAPAEGTSVTKSIETGLEMYLDDFSVIVMGQEIDPSMAGNPEFEFTFETSVTVEDRYHEVSEGRPLQLERHFAELDAEQYLGIDVQGESETMELTFASDLENKSVAFTWNADDEEYDVAWAEGHDGELDLLDGLEEDMDLRGLLPDGPVSPGDEWDIEPKRLTLLLSPGGNLQLMPEDWGDIDVPDELLESMSAMEDEMLELVEDLFDGSASATYVGTRDADGEELAEISLDMDIDASVDLSEFMDEIIAEITELEEEVDIDIQIELATVDFEWEGDGTLIWNRGAGRFHSFDLGGDLTIVVEFAISGDAEGETIEFEAMVEMSGTTSFSAETE